jgi:hypothetical protein
MSSRKAEVESAGKLAARSCINFNTSNCGDSAGIAPGSPG